MFYYKRFFSTNTTIRGELSDAQKENFRKLPNDAFFFNEMGRIFEDVTVAEVFASLEAINEFFYSGTPFFIRFSDGAIGVGLTMEEAQTAFLAGSE